MKGLIGADAQTRGTKEWGKKALPIDIRVIFELERCPFKKQWLPKLKSSYVKEYISTDAAYSL